MHRNFFCFGEGSKDAKWHVICLFSDVIYVNLVRYVFAFKAALRIFLDRC